MKEEKMNRIFLKDLGLDDDLIGQIIKDSGKNVEGFKTKLSELEKVKEILKAYEGVNVK